MGIQWVSGLTTRHWWSKQSETSESPRLGWTRQAVPISDEAKVEERFHRVDYDNMEWTVTIDDPKMYTKPWVAMNKFPMKLQPPNFDIWGKYQVEMICSPSEIKAYNDSVGNAESIGANQQ